MRKPNPFRTMAQLLLVAAGILTTLASGGEYLSVDVENGRPLVEYGRGPANKDPLRTQVVEFPKAVGIPLGDPLYVGELPFSYRRTTGPGSPALALASARKYASIHCRPAPTTSKWSPWRRPRR